jgi:hypothetical protein
VNITIGSTIVGSTHPISFGEKAKAFSCLPSILRNRSSSAGNSKSPPPTLSSCSVLSVNLCPMPAGSRKLGSDATSLIRNLLCSGKGAATSLIFRSTVLYFVLTRAVRSDPSPLPKSAMTSYILSKHTGTMRSLQQELKFAATVCREFAATR